jgi:hypothetical protein
MRGEVGDTADGVALDLDIRAEHLPDERFESTKFDNEEFVLGCGTASVHVQ